MFKMHLSGFSCGVFQHSVRLCGVEVVVIVGVVCHCCCSSFEIQDVPQMEFMSLVFTVFFTRMPVTVTVGDSGLCCCTCVTYFEC